MACGPQMVGRVLQDGGAKHQPAVGIAHGGPCLGPGRVEARDSDRRRMRNLLGWLGWAAVAVAIAAAAVMSLL
jgi:hypothetical protein